MLRSSDIINIYLFYLKIFQQGLPMRQPIMTGAPTGMMPMGMVGMQPTTNQPQMIIPQQTSLPTDHQNGKNNVQLDPFGAF